MNDTSTGNSGRSTLLGQVFKLLMRKERQAKIKVQNLMSNVVYHKNGSSILHQTIVSVIGLQIDGQKCSMPIISNEN